jgi:hypothetical protein
MTTWTTISNAAVAVGGIPSSTTVTALRDNPVAIAEAATGAPVVQAGWHPYDKVTVGDGKTGLIYDFAVNGLQANVTTPDFEDGYEYRIIGHVLTSSVSTAVRLNVNAYFETDAIYRRLAFGSDSSGINSFTCDVVIPIPRVPKQVHIVLGDMAVNNTVAMSNDLPYDATIQKLLRARVNFTSGSINSGKIWFLRRRDYISLP